MPDHVRRISRGRTVTGRTYSLGCTRWGAHWRNLANTIVPSACGGDEAVCQITLTTCYYWYETTAALLWSSNNRHIKQQKHNEEPVPGIRLTVELARHDVFEQFPAGNPVNNTTLTRLYTRHNSAKNRQ